MADTVWEAYAKEKERLIELLIHLDTYSCEQCQECGEHKYGNACDDLCFCGKTADHLIANGVTVTDNNVGSKWIPVTERLPEEEGWYLVYTTPKRAHKSINKAMFCKGYEWRNPEPYWRGAGGHWANVTHWMPLPQPPKGE